MESAAAREQLCEKKCDSLPKTMESAKLRSGQTKQAFTGVIPLEFFLDPVKQWI